MSLPCSGSFVERGKSIGVLIHIFLFLLIFLAGCYKHRANVLFPGAPESSLCKRTVDSQLSGGQVTRCLDWLLAVDAIM